MTTFLSWSNVSSSSRVKQFKRSSFTFEISARHQLKEERLIRMIVVCDVVNILFPFKFFYLLTVEVIVIDFFVIFILFLLCIFLVFFRLFILILLLFVIIFDVFVSIFVGFLFYLAFCLSRFGIFQIESVYFVNKACTCD
jgi:hypothetical protein